jgi:DNA (cytosine-5)-methyltransferase 1
MNAPKPPYRVPGMAEIAAVPWNGFTAISTFSGCGGSCLGYRMSGFRVAWASEFIPAACAVYRANHPETILDTRDIRTVQPAEILDAIGLKAGELDLMDGSPPCASFSTAGKREKHWGRAKKYSDTVQRTDDLFFEYVRLLDGLRPKVFVAENVSGLVKGVAKGYFLEILAKLKACGYRVGVKVLDAQWLGVPQARQRTIFIGVREDLGRAPVFPKPLPYRYSLRDALPWVVASGGIRDTGFGASTLRSADEPAATIMAGGAGGMNTSQFGVQTVTELRGGTGAAFDQKGQSFDLNQPCPTVLGTKPNQFSVEGLDMTRFAVGKEWDKLKPGESSEKYFNLVRPHPDEPCPTICASHGHPGVASVTHPSEKRKLAIAELKRICAFPDDFILTGTYGQQWERLGRAVPPVMMAAIGKVIRDEILT